MDNAYWNSTTDLVLLLICSSVLRTLEKIYSLLVAVRPLVPPPFGGSKRKVGWIFLADGLDWRVKLERIEDENICRSSLPTKASPSSPYLRLTDLI